MGSNALPSHLSKAIDAVRQLGNFAAHPIKSTNTGEIVDIEPGEAEWLLDVIEGLFDFYFVQPALLQKKREELDKKLAEASAEGLRPNGRDPMIAAERIAATYLRLNGFLLLPQFTVFIGGEHGHVDLVGLRAKGSEEKAGDFAFPIDKTFFAAIDPAITADPLNEFLGLVGEVKTNREKDAPKNEQVDYIRPFLGGVPIVPVFFSEGGKQPTWMETYIHVGNGYALKWVFGRASEMNARIESLTKSGSWILSDDALSEILVLGRLLGFIKDRPRPRKKAQPDAAAD